MPDLLSVVVPTQNRPERLATAVRSVLGQEYPALEVVVVDDGSTPETADMIDRLSSDDSRIVALRNDAPRGASATRNRGMEAATGEILAFCDDDDAWVPGAAEAAVGALGPGVGIVYGPHQVLQERTGRLVTFRPPPRANADLMRWMYVPASAFVMCRRALVEPELRFDTELITSEDWDMWLRCAELAPMAMAPAPLYRYVQHGDHRVTSALSAHREGHSRFLAKHRSSMTAACIAHHEYALALTTGDRTGLAHQVGLLARHPANIGSATVVAAEAVAGRVGRRRGDPGLALRVAARALARTTGTGRARGGVR